MISEFTTSAVAVLLLRAVAGILFFFQGYDKLFNLKTENVARAFNEPLSKLHIPASFLRPSIALSSFLELSCGLLLFIGLFKIVALYVLAADLIFIALIFSYIKPMWDMQYYFPRLFLVVLLLFSSSIPDIFAVDNLIGFSGK